MKRYPILRFLALLLTMTSLLQAQQTFDVKGMSLNIRVPVDAYPNDWATRRPMVYDVINSRDPDFVGLQEVQGGPLNDILANTGMSLVSGVDTAIIYRANRLTVIEHGEFYYTDTPDVLDWRLVWGQQYFRRCVWALFEQQSTGQRFYVYNNHCSYVGSAWMNSMQLLDNRIAGRTHAHPFLVTGDFNIPENDPSVDYLLNQGGVQMRDSFRDIKPTWNNDGTFHGFGGGRGGAKIDFVLAGGMDFQTLAAEIVHDNVDNRYPTDHFPVVGTVRFGSNEPPPPPPPAEEAAFVSAPSVIEPTGTQTVRVRYSANVERDILVKILDTSNSYAGHGLTRVTVAAGQEVEVDVEVALANNPPEHANYVWEVMLAPVGADWPNEILFVQQALEIRSSLTGLAAWMQDRFTQGERDNGSIGGEAADPDGDGLSNLLEYKLGLDPKSQETGRLAHRVTEMAGEDYLELEVIVQDSASDVTLVAERSYDLLSWSSDAAAVVVSNTANGDGTSTVVYRCSRALAMGPSYMRLRASN